MEVGGLGTIRGFEFKMKTTLKKNMEELLTSAMEFGYMQHERGNNMDKARAEFLNVLKK